MVHNKSYDYVIYGVMNLLWMSSITLEAHCFESFTCLFSIMKHD